MDQPRLTYLGVQVCEDATVTEWRDGQVLVATAAPMPVATELEIDAGAEPTLAKVLEAVEGAPGTMLLATTAKPAKAPEKRRARGKKE